MKLKLIVRTVLLWLLALVALMPLVMTLSGSLMGKTELIDNIGPVLQDGKGSVGMPIFPGMPTFKQYLQLLLDTPKFLDMFWNSVIATSAIEKFSSIREPIVKSTMIAIKPANAFAAFFLGFVSLSILK